MGSTLPTPCIWRQRGPSLPDQTLRSLPGRAVLPASGCDNPDTSRSASNGLELAENLAGRSHPSAPRRGGVRSQGIRGTIARSVKCHGIPPGTNSSTLPGT